MLTSSPLRTMGKHVPVLLITAQRTSTVLPRAARYVPSSLLLTTMAPTDRDTCLHTLLSRPPSGKFENACAGYDPRSPFSGVYHCVYVILLYSIGPTKKASVETSQAGSSMTYTLAALNLVSSSSSSASTILAVMMAKPTTLLHSLWQVEHTLSNSSTSPVGHATTKKPNIAWQETLHASSSIRGMSVCFLTTSKLATDLPITVPRKARLPTSILTTALTSFLVPTVSCFIVVHTIQSIWDWTQFVCLLPLL